MSLLGLSDSLSRPRNSQPRILRVGLLAACLIALAVGYQASAEDMEAPEARVEAAFLYHFTKLVAWPTNTLADSNSPIVIGILGKDTLGTELDQLKGLKSQQRDIKVARYDSVALATNCQVLFISSSEKRRLDYIFDELQNRPILTVGDIRGFANRGMIELVRSDGTFDLRINQSAAVKAKLRLSSRLIRLDKRIKPSNINPTNSPPEPDE